MLDYDAYYHIVEAIADAAASQPRSALALRPVCSRFRAKADAQLGRHVRLERRPSASSASSAQSSDAEGSPDHSAADCAFAADTDSDGDGALVVLSAAGSPLPLLYPSATPPPNRAWPALKPALAHARVIDFHTAPVHSERGLAHALRSMPLDTLRFVGVNDDEFALGALSCRRLVGLFAIGLPPTQPHWGMFFPRGRLPTVSHRVVLNVAVPRREGGDLLRMPAWQGMEPRGEWEMVFLFRSVDVLVPYPSLPPTPIGADIGGLLSIAIHVLDIDRARKYTIVGLEEVEWSRLGVRDPPSTTKERHLRGALEQLIVPVLGLEKGMVNIDEIQNRITFLTHAEYAAKVGREEYEGDLLPLDGLFDPFAAQGEGVSA